MCLCFTTNRSLIRSCRELCNSRGEVELHVHTQYTCNCDFQSPFNTNTRHRHSHSQIRVGKAENVRLATLTDQKPNIKNQELRRNLRTCFSF